MTERAKKLLVVLFISIIIFILAWIFRPFEPEEETFNQEDEEQEDVMPSPGEIPEF